MARATNRRSLLPRPPQAGSAVIPSTKQNREEFFRFSQTELLGVSNHPELEHQSLLAWGLSDSDEDPVPASDRNATIDVLFGCEHDLKWKYSITDKELKDILSHDTPTKQNGEPQRNIQFIFINNLDHGQLLENLSIPPSTLLILQKAGLSAVILSSIYDREETCVIMGNQCFQSQQKDGKLSSFDFAYRFVCGWDKSIETIGFMQFIRTRHQRTYFCINYPSGALDRFNAYLRISQSLVFHDLFLDALCAKYCLEKWQKTMGELRKQLLRHERKYQHGNNNFDGSTRELHGLIRDWTILGQDCLDLHTQLLFLQRVYSKYVEKLTDSKNRWEFDETTDVGNSFEALTSQCDNITHWTVVYRERTNIRINLLFHLANQREAQTNTQIAVSTAKVAEQTQRDSASMITIAAVTMLFLPGTFISAILSTTFFDYGENGLSVSKKWWILPAASIPLTLVVCGVWLGWRYWKLGRNKERADIKLRRRV